MKESEDQGYQAATATSPEPDENNKTEKDMKGLVYQGGSPEEIPPESDSQVPYSESPASEKEGEKSAPAPESPEKEREGRENSIISFSEKEGGGSRTILLVIIAVIIIAVAAYFVLNSNMIKSPGKSTVSTTVKGGASKPTTTISAFNPNKTVIVNLDVHYNYTGPSKINNTRCNEANTSSVSSYTANYNASTTFYLPLSESSGYCPLRINKIFANTKGFRVVNVTPSLPDAISPYSNTYLLFKISTPPFNYTGPLSLTINDN